jgi:hypothetical protein
MLSPALGGAFALEAALDDLGDRLPNMPIEEMAVWLRNGQPGSDTHQRVLSELMRRQTIAQLEATIAQKEAAKAQIDVARYSLWVVIFAGISAFVAAVSTVYTVISSH